MAYQPAKRERTLAVALLALLAVVAGILSLIDAARYMGWLSIGSIGGMKFFLPNAQWLAAIMAAIVGLIFFMVASWLWKLNPSGWLFVVVLTVLNLIFLFLAILGKTTISDVLLQLVINAVALILALWPSTKQAFTPLLPSPDQVRAAQAKVQASATAAKADVAAKSAAVSAAATTAAAPIPAAPVTKDDLTKIEGSSPAIAAALQAAGIANYSQLSKITPEQIRAILSKAGLTSDPTTWPRQAALAASGQWAELQAYQAQLKGGKVV